MSAPAEETSRGPQQDQGEDAEAVYLCPFDGETAQQCSEMITAALLSELDTSRDPHLPGYHSDHSNRGKLRPPRSRFVDLCTGMRMHYHEYGSGQEVVLLLHDLAESCLLWQHVAADLAELDYHVFALDLRGHGQTTRSPGGHYSAKALADDVESFLLERDLYVRPVAVVGAGLGADVAITLGARNPRLVGALALIDYSPEALQQLVFFPLQAATFSATEEFVACITSPAIGQFARTGKAARAAASAILGPPTAQDRAHMRMDPRWFYRPSEPEQATAALGELRCHVTFICSACSQWFTPEEVREVAQAASNAVSCSVVRVPGAMGYPASEAPKALVKVLLEVLQEAGPSLLVANMETRRPELLDIRPLPQYATLEEALKALGPREVPTKDAMEDELRRLTIEEHSACQA
eukprot:jgi/Botrbrau1/22622/Bobra.176_1s0050.1